MENDTMIFAPRQIFQYIRNTVISSLRVVFQLFLNMIFTNDPKKVGQLWLNGRCQFVWLREHVGRKIALRMFEKKESRFFLKTIKEGAICLDIGANVGYFTNLFASRVGEKGRVIAVEPVSRNVLLIQLASNINNADAVVKVISAAVSDTDSSLSLSQIDDSSYASISVAGKKEAGQVQAITLDALCKGLELPRIDILKMDIEGFEYRALQGMQKILSDRVVRPKLMMIELYSDHLQKFGSSISQICDYLNHFGYEPHVLDNSGNLVPFRTEHHNKIYNVFFIEGNAEV